MISGSGTCMAVAGAICLALGAPMSHAASDAGPAAPPAAASPEIASPDGVSPSIGAVSPRDIASTAGTSSPSEPARSRRLDLRAPDITQIYTARQIETLLARTTDPDMEEVHVQRSFQRPTMPVVWSGIAAPVWALLHPLQAWRILAPLPQEQTAGQAYQAPDATAGYLTPAALSYY